MILAQGMMAGTPAQGVTDTAAVVGESGPRTFRTLVRGSCWRLVNGAAAGDAETVQPVAGLRSFDGTRIARDQAVQLAHAGIALSEFQQRVALLQLRCRSLVAAGILLQHFVVILHRGFKVALAILDVGKIELRVSCQIGIGVILQIVARTPATKGRTCRSCSRAERCCRATSGGGAAELASPPGPGAAGVAPGAAVMPGWPAGRFCPPCCMSSSCLLTFASRDFSSSTESCSDCTWLES